MWVVVVVETNVESQTTTGKTSGIEETDREAKTTTLKTLSWGEETN